MKITQKKLEEKITIVNILCDKCGKHIDQLNDNYLDNYFEGGYFSKFFGDNVGGEFQVCEQCLWEWIQTFKNKEWIINRV